MPSAPLIDPDDEPREMERFIRWFTNHPDKSESTATRYRTELRRWVGWADERGVPLLDADPRDVEDFLLQVNDEYSDNTFVNARAALSQFYQREGDFPEGETPVDRADVGSWSTTTDKESGTRDTIHWLKPDQVDALVEHAPAPTLRNKLILRLMTQTGVRASELATIQCGKNPDWGSNELGDIDRDERVIRVVDHKSDDSRITVYQPSLDALLRLWVETERETVYQASASEYLFPTTQSEHIHPQRVNGIVRDAAERAGIQKVYGETADGRERSEITSHVLRHTYAMNALKNDMDTRWLQMALGHESIETTQKYLKANDEDLIEALRQRGPSF
jgi:integrase/recombinase XerD